MRCSCCNELLDAYESTRRNALTNEFLDMCNVCYETIKSEVQSIGRIDLQQHEMCPDQTSWHDACYTYK